MDAGSIFIGIVLLVVAWACWTYLPPPFNVVGGLVFGLLGLYFLLVGLVGPLDSIGEGGRGVLLPFLCAPWLRRLRSLS